VTVEIESWAETVPRRARHLIPKGLPRRGELLALCAVAVVVAHLVLAQLTLVLAVVFFVVGKVSRWRRSWLLVPVFAGMTWALAVGPGVALDGLTAGPGSILWHLAGGHLAGQAGQPFAGFTGVWHRLPGQFPVALIAGAVEAGLAGWLDWLHTDEWAVPSPCPGLVAAARRFLTVRAVRSGAVVTRDGCVLGVVPSTGAVAELSWAALGRGALVAGSSGQDVTLTGLQVVHAALRRRKPVIVFGQGDAAVSQMVDTACAATGTPLLAGAGADLGRVVRERAAALIPAVTPELAARACADLASLAGDLRRIGVDGDTLVWVPHGSRVPADALATLLSGCADSGVGVLVGATSTETVAALDCVAGTVIAFRVTDRELADQLAARFGTRLLPGPAAAVLAGRGPAPGSGAGTAMPAVSSVPSASAVELVPSPVIPASALLALRPAKFMLAVSTPRGRLVSACRLVPARLPSALPPPPAPAPRLVPAAPSASAPPVGYGWEAVP